MGIREASSEDATKIAEIHKFSCLDTYPNSAHGVEKSDIESAKLDSEVRVKQWMSRIESQTGNEKIWVFESDGILIGFCYALKKEKINEIYSIYLLPEYTGRGIGKKLMEVASGWVGADKDLMLEVVPYNEAAIRFYESLGFTKTGRQSEFTFNPDGQGKEIPLIEMLRSRIQSVLTNPS